MARDGTQVALPHPPGLPERAASRPSRNGYANGGAPLPPHLPRSDIRDRAAAASHRRRTFVLRAAGEGPDGKRAARLPVTANDSCTLLPPDEVPVHEWPDYLLVCPCKQATKGAVARAVLDGHASLGSLA